MNDEKQQPLPEGTKMTSLVQQVAPPAAATDLQSALKRLTGQKPKAAVAPQVKSKGSNTVPLSKDDREAISRLSVLLGAVTLPSERRALTQEEQLKLLALGADSKRVKAVVELAVDNVKKAVFNHLDVGLEATRDADEALPLDSKGKHYTVAGEIEIEGMRMTRELAEGAATVPVAALYHLWQTGVISRADYYAATRRPELPREVDEQGLLELMNRKPAINEALKPHIQAGTVTASFHIRPAAGGGK